VLLADKLAHSRLLVEWLVRLKSRDTGLGAINGDLSQRTSCERGFCDSYIDEQLLAF
jgi:hypothetical protein